MNPSPKVAARSSLLSAFIGLGLASAFLPRSAEAGIAIIGSLAREHTLAPGEAFGGEVLVRNTGKAVTTVRVSQADYCFTADGSNDFPSAGSLPRSNAPWITVDNTIFQVAPGDTFAIHYQGQVPGKFAENGTRWSLLLVQETNASVNAQGIQTIARYGIQVVTDVGGTGKRSVRFLNRAVEHQGSKSQVVIDLENDGERLIFPQVWVELFTAAGKRIGRFESKPDRLYPACSIRCPIDIASVPAGSYQAIIYVDCGEDQIVGTRCALEL